MLAPGLARPASPEKAFDHERSSSFSPLTSLLRF
jgi:hypothetical protein